MQDRNKVEWPATNENWLSVVDDLIEKMMEGDADECSDAVAK